MAHICGFERDQLLLLPEAVDDYVGSDNPVRFIDAFVDGLDLAETGFARVEPKATGRPGYAPGDLLKLYIYGYLNRVRSSRRLEAECHRNIEVIWLLRTLKPDFKTIADFRADNRAAFKAVFRAFTLLCKRLDLFGRELLAVDGTRIKAVNNKDRNFTRNSLEKFIKAADERLADYLKRLDEGDAAEQATGGARVKNLAQKIEALSKKRGEYDALLKNPRTHGRRPDIAHRSRQPRHGGAYACRRRIQRSGRCRRQEQADRRAGSDQPGRRHGAVAGDRRTGAENPRCRDHRCRRRRGLLPNRGYRSLREGGADAACAEAATRLVSRPTAFFARTSSSMTRNGTPTPARAVTN